MYLNDLAYFYYPLPLCLRVVSLAQLPSTSDIISLAGAYQGGFAALAAAGTTENACTAGRRKLGCICTRLAERQRMQEAEANRIAEPMAASEAMPPRRALPLPRRRTPSSCKPAMESLSLGGCKGGCSLSEEREQPPLFRVPCTVQGNHSLLSAKKIFTCCGQELRKRADRPARSRQH